MPMPEIQRRLLRRIVLDLVMLQLLLVVLNHLGQLLGVLHELGLNLLEPLVLAVVL